MMTNEYSMQEAVELTGLSEHTLRYYERIGLITEINRAESGHRRYTQANINRITFLLKLRRTGMPLEQMREFAALYTADRDTAAERCDMLLEHRRKVLCDMQELQEALNVIDYKLNLYTEEMQEKKNGRK